MCRPCRESGTRPGTWALQGSTGRVWQELGPGSRRTLRNRHKGTPGSSTSRGREPNDDRRQLQRGDPTTTPPRRRDGVPPCHGTVGGTVSPLRRGTTPGTDTTVSELSVPPPCRNHRDPLRKGVVPGPRVSFLYQRTVQQPIVTLIKVIVHVRKLEVNISDVPLFSVVYHVTESRT